MPRKSMTDSQLSAFFRKMTARRDTPIIGDYLQALLATGLYGNTLEETVRILTCRGIEQAIAAGAIPRRWMRPEYPHVSQDQE